MIFPFLHETPPLQSGGVSYAVSIETLCRVLRAGRIFMQFMRNTKKEKYRQVHTGIEKNSILGYKRNESKIGLC